MSTTALSITIYENGQEVGWTVPDIVDAIEELWSPTYHSERSFEVDDGYLVYRDTATETCLPFPEEWLTKIIRFGTKTDLRLVGDRIPLTNTVKVEFRPE
jgi:hypothetical protein